MSTIGHTLVNYVKINQKIEIDNSPLNLKNDQFKFIDMKIDLFSVYS